MNLVPSNVSAALALLLLPASVVAQAIDACPNLKANEAALLGHVQDPGLGGMSVLGAVVTAQWEVDGERRTADGSVPDDGVYLICGVPQGIELTLQATFSGREGPIVEVMIAERALRQDLTVSLSGQEIPDDAPLFIGPDNTGRCPDLRAPRLVQCILLDECRYNRLGRVRARRVGTGTDTRELVETFVRDARLLDAHAVRDIRVGYEQRGLEIVLVSIEGTGIEFTEERCKQWLLSPIVL